jgi:hypothetical protein
MDTERDAAFEAWWKKSGRFHKPFAKMDVQVAWEAAYQAGQQAERERCAKIAERTGSAFSDGRGAVCGDIAKAIREGGA